MVILPDPDSSSSYAPVSPAHFSLTSSSYPSSSTPLQSLQNPSWSVFQYVSSLSVSFSVLFSNKQFLLGFYSVCLLFSAVGNSIFAKKMTNHMLNYPYFLSQWTTFVYLPIFGSVVLYEFYFTDWITEEQTKFPKYKFFVMGALDSVAGIFSLFGGVYTSGNTQGLLFQAVVPVTMVMAYFILKTRYKLLQILGAMIILGGVFAVILPKFLNPETAGAEVPDKPLFNIIYLMAIFPTAFSTIYKEIAFNDVELDVNYLQFWVAVWQFVFGFLLIPLNTLSFLGSQQISWSELPNTLENGFKCLLGINTIVTNCFASSSLGTPCDSCEGAWIPTMIYLLFNCAYNVFIILLVKYGSAAILYIIMTIRLPIINIAFSLSFIENPPEPLETFTIIGLVLIIIGLSSYRYGSMASGADDKDQEPELMPEGRLIKKQHQPRRYSEIRSNFYTKLGIFNSPGGELRKSRWGVPQLSVITEETFD